MTDEEPKPDEAEDQDGAHHFVTHLATMEQQVGRHVIHALKQEDVVAVLTTVLPRPDGQSIVSVGLDDELLEQVRGVLAESDADELPRVPCVGFHCFSPAKKKDVEEEKP